MWQLYCPAYSPVVLPLGLNKADQGLLHGTSRRPKVVQVLPKGTQVEPKVGPRREKEGRRAPKGNQERLKIHSHSHIIYANPRSNAIQRSATLITIKIGILCNTVAGRKKRYSICIRHVWMCIPYESMCL